MSSRAQADISAAASEPETSFGCESMKRAVAAGSVWASSARNGRRRAAPLPKAPKSRRSTVEHVVGAAEPSASNTGFRLSKSGKLWSERKACFRFQIEPGGIKGHQSNRLQRRFGKRAQFPGPLLSLLRRGCRQQILHFGKADLGETFHPQIVVWQSAGSAGNRRVIGRDMSNVRRLLDFGWKGRE